MASHDLGSAQVHVLKRKSEGVSPVEILDGANYEGRDASKIWAPTNFAGNDILSAASR
jgi:hypothetical protein